MGSDHLCLSVQVAVLPDPVLQTVRSLYHSTACKDNCLTFKHISPLFPWCPVSLPNGWKLLVGSKSQFSLKDNGRSGEIQFLSEHSGGSELHLDMLS